MRIRATNLKIYLLLALAICLSTLATVPPFTDVDRFFTPVDLPVSQVDPIPVGLAGGIIAFIQTEDQCGTASLRILADPDRVLTIGGVPIPANGYVLVRRYAPLFNSATQTCDIPNPANIYGASQPQINPAGLHAVGAYDINANTTRVIITFQRSEGGYAQGSSCPNLVAALGAVDLNGDGDLGDQVLQYSQIIIDKPTKNITSIAPMINTGFIGDVPFGPVNNGKLIAALTSEDSLKTCSCVNGQLTCSNGTDLNGDGVPFSGVLRFYDIDTGVVTNTGLGLDAWQCVASPDQIRYPEIAVHGGQPVLVMGDNLLAFLTREFLLQPDASQPGSSGPPPVSPFPCIAKPGRDLNNDGDFNDLVVRYINLNGSLTTPILGLTLSQGTENLNGQGSSSANSDAGLIGTDGAKVAFSIAESSSLISPYFAPCTDPPDLNQNCQGGDVVLQIYDAAFGAGTTTNVGATATSPPFSIGPHVNSKFSHGIAAFVTPEFREGGNGTTTGTDLNCDGDKFDSILRFLDISNQTVVNTKIPMVDGVSGGPDLMRRVLIGTDGVIILYEDFPPTSSGLPIAPIHYIKVGAGVPAASCAASSTTTTAPPTTVPPTTTTLPPTTTTLPPTTTTLPPTTTTLPPTTTTLPPTTTTLPPTTTTLPPPPTTTTTLPPVTPVTVLVSPADMKGWAFAEETATGSGAMVPGPGTAPMGTGSARLLVDSTGGAVLGIAAYQGKRLADLTNLQYSTYRASGGASLAISLQFNIDNDVTDADLGWKGRLVFEPYYTETVLTGVWQTWNPMAGKWWATAAPVNSFASQGAPKTWSQILAAFPNIGIHPTMGGVLFKAGGGWTGGFDGNADAFTIGVSGVGVTIYDFEPTPTTTTSSTTLPPTTTTLPPTTTTLPPTTTTTTTTTTTSTTLPSSPQAKIDQLISQISNLTSLNAGQRNSLIVKLNAAKDSLARGNRTAAINQLNAFINEVQALKQSGKLSAAVADQLINQAQAVIGQI